MTISNIEIDRNINTLRVKSKEFSQIDNIKLASMFEETISHIKERTIR